MAINRFTKIPTPEYVPQFVPEALDTNLFSAMSDNVNDTYNAALNQYSKDTFKVDYHNNLQADAERVLGEFTKQQDEVVNTLLKDKDVNKASRMMAGLYKEYNQSLASGDLKYLQQSHDKYKEDMSSIAQGIKDPVSKQMEIDRYNKEYITDLKDEFGNYNQSSDPNYFEMPDIYKAVTDSLDTIKSNTFAYQDGDGNTWRPQLSTDGQLIGFSNKSGTTESIGTDRARKIITGYIKGNPILQSQIKSVSPYYPEGAMEEAMVNAIEAGASAVSFTKETVNRRDMPLPKAQENSEGPESPDYAPHVFAIPLTVRTATEIAVTTPENLNKAMFNFATYYHKIQEIHSVVKVS